MNSFSLLNEVLYKDRILRIKDVNNGSKKLLKVVNVSELDSKIVVVVVSEMNKINELNVNGLMKYKVIEINDDSLYRISREYKNHLDEINPLKYFEESGVYEILNEILMILNRLNEVGLFHSDLKPSNIFINDENEVIINDYLNNLLYKGREGKRITGKMEDLCFVSIDELIGKELDISSDIWNFGLIFYYMLSGKYPFIGSTISETINNILNVKYEELECEYGEKLNSFLRRLVVKEKNNRLRLSEIFSELKKLNESELPVIPFEEEEIKISEDLKNRINCEIDKCKKENGDYLSFYDLKMRDEGMKYLCSKLDVMNNVTEINMITNELSSIGLNKFSECLKFFPNLEELYLHNNSFGKNSLKLFSENLHFIPKLKDLVLGKCGLGEIDMKYLSSHFKDIPNLEWLNIGGDDGVKYLCENINEIPKLNTLYLDDNEISDNGGEMLIKNLPKCKELKLLWMKENKISNYEDFKRRMKEKHPNKDLKIDY